MVAGFLVLTGTSLAGGAPSPIVASEFVFERAPFRSAHASTIVETRDGLLARVVRRHGGGAPGRRHLGCRGDARPAGPRRSRSRTAAARRHAPPLLEPRALPAVARPAAALLQGRPEPARVVGPRAHLRPTRGGRGRTRSGCRTGSSARSAPSPSSWPAATCSPDRAPRTRAGSCTWSAGRPATWPRPPRGGRAARSTTRGSSRRSSRRSSCTRPRGCRSSAAAGRGSSPRPGPRTAGRTWGRMTATALPNPSAGIDAVRLADGRFLLVYNPTTSGRDRLEIAVSADGKAWRPRRRPRGLAGRVLLPRDDPGARRPGARHLHVEARADPARRRRPRGDTVEGKKPGDRPWSRTKSRAQDQHTPAHQRFLVSKRAALP